MTRDRFARYEEETRTIGAALGQLSRDVQAPPDFLARVMAKADQLPAPRQGFLARCTNTFLWPMTVTTRVAVAALFVLAVIGAAPQYSTWINAYVLDVPAGAIQEARQQEQLWERNFACATRLDRNSRNYAAITGEQVTMVAWACPSGDVLVTVESSKEEVAQRSVWITLETSRQAEHRFRGFMRQAFAAPRPLRLSKRAEPMIHVLCQKWLPNRLIKRRIQLADKGCVDEVINPRTGRVLKRQKAPCDRAC